MSARCRTSGVLTRNLTRSNTPQFSQRGSAAVAVLIALVVLSLVVVGVVISGARDQQLGGLRVQGERAAFAADSAANMAVKELMDNTDLDGDGGIGTLSNDSNTATDPTINSGTRLWATKAVSGVTTTVTARGQNADAARAVRVALSGSGASSSHVGTIMFVVMNSASLDSQESAKRTLMQGWGYTVVPITASASQGAYDAAALVSSVAYVSETVTSSDVSTKLTNATIGVITEESVLCTYLGFSSSMTTFSDTQIDISNTTHYITSTLASGVHAIYASSQPVRYLSGTQGGYTVLGKKISTANATLAVMERGDTLYAGGTAAGRRVYLPFGNTGYDVNSLTADGLTIMKRSIEWCLLPVGHWKLDDASGTAALDSISARNGTLSGGVWGTGKLSGGLVLNGSTDYVSIANHTQFQVTQALTIAGWIKSANWPADSNWASVILRKGDANPNNWELHVCVGRVKLTLDDYDTYSIAGDTTLATNTWYHAAATWDGATVRIYVNGVLDNTPTARAAPIGTDSRAVYLGGRIDATDITNGTVDDVRFYNRALTAAEIADLAAGGKPKITSWTQVDPNQ